MGAEDNTGDPWGSDTITGLGEHWESPGGDTGTELGGTAVGTGGSAAPLGGKALTNGGDEGGVEGIVGEAEEDAGLADPRVPDEQQLEEQVVGFLRHGGGRGGSRRPSSPPPSPGPAAPEGGGDGGGRRGGGRGRERGGGGGPQNGFLWRGGLARSPRPRLLTGRRRRQPS